MTRSMDGFYSALFSGKAGEGSAMFILSDGVLVGADPLGVLFDGSYTPDGKGGFAGKVIVKAPPNGELVQGVTTGPDGLTYEVGIEIPADFETRPFLTLSTPLGPINFVLKRLRSVG
ncbi:hypothetical protein [Brevundimonas aurantiaca]|uniref:hypothetical protein n=1 Tax=Brevundimonas aurantiaca TaxID=74316 RepID=UPI002FDE281D